MGSINRWEGSNRQHLPDQGREAKLAKDSPALHEKNKIQRILMDAAFQQARAEAAEHGQPLPSAHEVWFGEDVYDPNNLSSRFSALFESRPDDFRLVSGSPEDIAKMLERIKRYQNPSDAIH